MIFYNNFLKNLMVLNRNLFNGIFALAPAATLFAVHRKLNDKEGKAPISLEILQAKNGGNNFVGKEQKAREMVNKFLVKTFENDHKNTLNL